VAAYRVVQEYVVRNASGYGVRRVLRSERLAMDYVGGFLLCL
jgi:hypothetical protein